MWVFPSFPQHNFKTLSKVFLQMKALVRQVAAPVADLGDEHLVAIAGNQVRAVSPCVFKLKGDILNI